MDETTMTPEEIAAKKLHEEQAGTEETTTEPVEETPAETTEETPA